MSVTRSYKRPRLRPHPRVAWRRVPRYWPFLVWLAVVLCVSWLYVRSGGFAGMMGVVDTCAEPIAPLETARLVTLHVRPGQVVTAGQIVAEMDTSLLNAELELQRAQLAEAQETMARYRQNLVRMLYDAQSEARDAETELALQMLNARRDESRLGVLREEARRRHELMEHNLLDAVAAQALDAEVAALAEAVKAYPEILRVCRRRQQESERDMESIREWLNLDGEESAADVGEVLVSRMEAERDVLRQATALLSMRRERYTLRASRAGIVSRVLFAPGDVVSEGAMIVRIVAEKPDCVVGLLPETHVTDLAVGQAVRIFRRGRCPRYVRGVVLSVGPEIRDLPARVSPIRGQAVRGRRVSVSLLEKSDLLAGETVEVRPDCLGVVDVLKVIKRGFD